MLDAHVGHRYSKEEQEFSVWMRIIVCEADRKDDPILQDYSSRVCLCVCVWGS